MSPWKGCAVVDLFVEHDGSASAHIPSSVAGTIHWPGDTAM